MWSVTTLLCVAGTVFVYAVVRRLYLRYKHPLINVVGLSAAVVISALLLLDVPYAAYEPARKIMTALIGAATVSLALPLYRYRKLLLRHAVAIIVSVSAGAFVAMFSAGLIAQSAACRVKWSCPSSPKGFPFPLPWRSPKSTTGFLPWPPPSWWLPALWARCWVSGP